MKTNPLANLPIQKNVIWTPKRSGGVIVLATVAELRVIAAEEKSRHFVWPDEGDFLKLIGSQGTFKMNAGNETLPPLIVEPRYALQILRLYDEASTADNQAKMERMVSLNRGSFAKVLDASVMYCATVSGV